MDEPEDATSAKRSRKTQPPANEEAVASTSAASSGATVPVPGLATPPETYAEYMEDIPLITLAALPLAAIVDARMKSDGPQKPTRAGTPGDSSPCDFEKAFTDYIDTDTVDAPQPPRTLRRERSVEDDILTSVCCGGGATADANIELDISDEFMVIELDISDVAYVHDAPPASSSAQSMASEARPYEYYNNRR